MSALQAQVVSSLEGLTDEDLMFLLDMINRFMKPVNSEKTVGKVERKLGLYKDRKFIADGHDLDEFNDEICEMFGVGE